MVACLGSVGIWVGVVLGLVCKQFGASGKRHVFHSQTQELLMCHWVMCRVCALAHLRSLRTIHRRIRHLYAPQAVDEYRRGEGPAPARRASPSSSLSPSCPTLATARAEWATRREPAAYDVEMKDHVLDLQTITRHDEPGDRIIEQFIQGWLTVSGVHGAPLSPMCGKHG
jgi:hypothetical protein